MKNIFKKASIPLLFICMLAACKREPTDFRDFLDNKEIVYPGIISQPRVFSGNERILLTWHPSPDPTVSHYVVYWNNYADSIIVTANTHNPSDTVKCLINDLKEYTYTFFIFSFDEQGNISISTEIDNGRVYGDIYQGNLSNRPYNREVPGAYNNDDYTSLTLNFLPPTDTVNISTEIDYINTMGLTKKVWLSPDSSSITLNDYKVGTPISYRSSYVPVTGGIDTFYVSAYDTLPEIAVMCDKSLFSAMHLMGDASIREGTSFEWIWDGKPGSYPEVYYTLGAAMPHTFTFDMGKVYNDLCKFTEAGRGDYAPRNPAVFEIWGIADTSSAITALPATDPDWDDQMSANGWMLLGTASRDDDGIDPVTFNLIANPQPVRFIRIRVLSGVDPNTNFSHMSEVTPWYYP